MIFTLMPLIFAVGIIAIAFEDYIRINKAAIAVGMSIILWFLLLMGGESIFIRYGNPVLAEWIKAYPQLLNLSVTEQTNMFIERMIVTSLGDVSETLFFVLGSMAIIELVDSHGGFEIIVNSIHTRSKRRLLWIFSFLTFFLSAVLGNLATVIVMIAIMRKLISQRQDRLIYASMSIIAANAGGAWSPIGDVTTLLLWTGGNVSVGHQISHIFLPSLTMLLVSLIACTYYIKKGEEIVFGEDRLKDPFVSRIDPKFKKWLLWVGLASLASVPLLQSWFNMPPFMGVLLGLCVMWVMTDRRWFNRRVKALQELRVSRVFTRIDVTTVLFFLGILMSVASLKTAGQLSRMSLFLDNNIGQPDTISFILGIASSFLDNVALVAGTIGMYPIADTGAFMLNGSFWTFLCYCAVTGGSILIIGSASGVTVMGMEKISFGYYLKKFTPLALVGYVSGAGVYLLFQYVFGF